jgi:YidC/Oxa1 family membrane protein insertase
MGMDRNSIIGFVLLGVLLFIYLFISTKNTHELEAQRKREADSIAYVKAKQAAVVHAKDTTLTAARSVDTATGFNKAVTGTERLTTVENELIKVVFSNKGGQPVTVELKQFKAYDSTPVKLISPGTNNHLNYSITVAQSQVSAITDLYFNDAQVVKNADGSQTISYQLPTPAGESLIHEFTIRPNDYLVDWNVVIGNPGALFYQNNFILSWQSQLEKTQRNVTYERRLAGISFYEDNQFDYMVAKTERTLEKPVQWLAVSQQFFNMTLIAKNGFNSGIIHLAKETSDSSTGVERAEVSLQPKSPA